MEKNKEVCIGDLSVVSAKMFDVFICFVITCDVQIQTGDCLIAYCHSNEIMSLHILYFEYRFQHIGLSQC